MTGKPFAINLEYCDTKLPLNMDEDGKELPSHMYTDNVFLVHRFRLAKLLGDCSEKMLFMSRQKPLTWSDICNMDKQVRAELESVPHFLQIGNSRSIVESVQAYLLYSLAQRTILIIHLPFIPKVTSIPVVRVFREKAIEAAYALLEPLRGFDVREAIVQHGYVVCSYALSVIEMDFHHNPAIVDGERAIEIVGMFRDLLKAHFETHLHKSHILRTLEFFEKMQESLRARIRARDTSQSVSPPTRIVSEADIFGTYDYDMTDWDSFMKTADLSFLTEAMP